MRFISHLKFVIIGMAYLFIINHITYANEPADETSHIATQKEVDVFLKKIDVLQSELEKINLKINELSNKNQKKLIKPENKLTPQEMQAASSSIFIPGGAPRPVTDNKKPAAEETTPVAKVPPKDQSSDKDQSQQDKANALSDSSTNSNSNADNYDNSNGYYPNIIPTSSNQQVTLSLNAYNLGTYTYDSSQSSVSFSFVDSIALTLNFNNFSVYNLKICNSSYENCQTVTNNPSTNEYQLSTSQLNIVGANLGATQISLSNETYFIPTFYVQYTSTSSSSTLLNGSFSFPTTSSDMSCSTASNTASCQLLDSAQVSFSTN
ncbi:hypothetical protein L3V82_11120 [Thiotrichales bacterium 19S3-7]|nr:hypothetical protein [Thiotrichales bacterium 19S3-7]MCF6802749.1 hypothetical protein [Thiotrichales bacterium 19S3-11]